MNPLTRRLTAWLRDQPSPPTSAAAYRLARRHRLDGTLYHIGPLASDRDARSAHAIWLRDLTAHLRRARTVARIWPTWAPPPMPIKGADLGEHLFRDPGARRSIDIDLLLPDPYFAPVAAALSRQARRRTYPSYERRADEPLCGVGFFVGGVLIELHRHPAPRHRAPLDGADIYGRGTPARLGNSLDVLAPCPLDRAAICVANLAKGALYSDLADLLDLTLCLRATPPDDRRRHLDDVGLGRAYRAATDRLRRAGLPTEHAPRAPRAVRTLVGLLPRPSQPPSEPPALTFQLLKWALCEAPARRAMVERGARTLLRRPQPKP